MFSLLNWLLGVFAAIKLSGRQKRRAKCFKPEPHELLLTCITMQLLLWAQFPVSSACKGHRKSLSDRQGECCSVPSLSRPCLASTTLSSELFLETSCLLSKFQHGQRCDCTLITATFSIPSRVWFAGVWGWMNPSCLITHGMAAGLGRICFKAQPNPRWWDRRTFRIQPPHFHLPFSPAAVSKLNGSTPGIPLDTNPG